MSTQQHQEAEVSRQNTARSNLNPPLPFFYMGMSLFFMILVFIGFGPSYFMPLLSGQEASTITVEMSWIVHVHAIIYLAWMVLLILQTILISKDKTEAHMKLGLCGVGLGIVVILIGGLMTYLSFWGFISKLDLDMATAVFRTGPSWGGIIAFTILLFLGFRNRGKPQTHKRYMLLATIALLFAAIDRMYFLLGNRAGLIMFVIIMILIISHDLYTQKRIHHATATGGSVLALYAAYIHLFLPYYLPQIFG